MDRGKINLIKQCRAEAIRLLQKNSTPFGILASSYSSRAKERNYLSVFTRDVGICALGIVKTQDKKLLSSLKTSLKTLANFQADNGQIPNFVKDGKIADFWYTDCIDATLWWLIAVAELKQISQFKNEIKKALGWLSAREHPAFYLLSQQEASDWADLMPRKGFVLYSNALWYRVKVLYKLKNTKETKSYFSYFFGAESVPQKVANKNPRLIKLLKFAKTKRKKYLLSYVAFGEHGKDVDVFGNLLAILFGLNSKKRNREILNYFLTQRVNKPFPVRAVLNPVQNNREYMQMHNNQNKKFSYHNGGIWPFIGAFWILALSQNNFKKQAQNDLNNLAELNLGHNFNEWFDPKTKRAMGKAGQSWNAGAFLLAGF